jgi:trigger factor
VSVQDSDIDEMLENLRKQRTEFVEVERESADGDQIVIDFTGRMDGEEFDGGKAEKAPLVLGSNAMIPGFESQLLGLKAGASKTIQITFPEDYQADHLAGKNTEFDIVVHAVKEPRLPEFDEELVRSFGIEDGTLESLRADIRKNMERELKQRVDNKLKSQIMDGLVKLNPIDVPSALVSEEIQRQREQLLQQMPAESDSSMLADELFAEQATRRVQLGLVVGEIIQQRQIKADAAAVRDQVEQLASSYQDPQQVIDYYYGNPEMLKNIEGLVLEEAVTAAVLEAATVVDEPTTFKDIMNPPATSSPADSENS